MEDHKKKACEESLLHFPRSERYSTRKVVLYDIALTTVYELYGKLQSRRAQLAVFPESGSHASVITFTVGTVAGDPDQVHSAEPKPAERQRVVDDRVQAQLSASRIGGGGGCGCGCGGGSNHRRPDTTVRLVGRGQRHRRLRRWERRPRRQRR